jgi:hypothetical protein
MYMEKTFKVLVILFAVVGIGLFGYHWFSQWHTKTVEQSLKKEQKKHLDRIAQLEAEITQLKQALEVQESTTPSESELANVFGPEKSMEPIIIGKMDCKKITAQAVAFFQYLDSKAYLIWPGINMQAEELFDQISKQLAAAPPINVGEMENLYSLLRNVTHFYRILGKNRINLMKEILDSESDVMEPAMSVLFAWIITCNKNTDRLNLNTLYQYAHFFLNTLGGRSYLLRRDTKQRLLINYYALLVIDMANDAKLNSYGFDIRPHLDYVFYDLNNQKGLMYRQRYLSRLSALQNKYQ